MAVVTTIIANSAIGLQPARTISGQLLYSSNHWASSCLAGYYYIFQLLTKKISWVPWGHPVTEVKLLKTEAIRKNYWKCPKPKKPQNPTQRATDYYGATHIVQCYRVLESILWQQEGPNRGWNTVSEKLFHLLLLRTCKKFECLNVYLACTREILIYLFYWILVCCKFKNI